MNAALVKISWLNADNEAREVFVSAKHSVEVKEIIDFYAGNRDVKVSENHPPRIEKK